MKKRNQGYRLMEKFWLNIDKPEQAALADTIELLKNQRLFHRAIREGLNIWVELSKGKVDTLLKVFPGITEALSQHLNSQTEINQFEHLLNQQAEIMRRLESGLPQLAASAPRPQVTFEEEELVLEDNDVDGTSNFVDSLSMF